MGPARGERRLALGRLLNPPRAVIVGTGRSGSGYIAQVLRAARVVCGHEDWFNPWDSHVAGLDVESSWAAIVEGLDDFDGAIFHQVRHPLDVISSLVKSQSTGEYAAMRDRMFPQVPDDPIELAMFNWFYFVEACEHVAHRTWRLEDIDAALIIDIAKAVDIEVTPAEAETALAIVPRTFNFHGEGRQLDWSDLPDGWLKNQIRAWADLWWGQ